MYLGTNKEKTVRKFFKWQEIRLSAKNYGVTPYTRYPYRMDWIIFVEVRTKPDRGEDDSGFGAGEGFASI